MGISRLSLYRELGVDFSISSSVLLAAYEREALRELRGEEGHDATSFYISNFPGDDPRACGRAAVYSLMGLPRTPADPTGKRWMDGGKDLEMQFIQRFAADGALLTGDESRGERQTKLTDPETWASGAVDAIILPYGWRKGLVVEVKNTSAEKMAAMRSDPSDTPFSHDKYVRQLKTYIGYAHEQNFAPKVVLCADSWAITKPALMGLRWCPVHQGFGCATKEVQLDPPTEGELLYASRDPQRGNSIDTLSYYFEYDPDFLLAGKEKLRAWRESFEQGALPPHVLENERKKWTAQPCKYCPWAGRNANVPGCKMDYSNGVTRMEESSWIKRAKEVRPQYDYEAVRAAVFARWEVPDQLAQKYEEVEAA